MMKHTPGPWKCDKSPVCGEWFVRSDGKLEPGRGYQYICSLPGDMFRANAHLIAAAPDLLEAVEDVLEQLEKWDGTLTAYDGHIDFTDLIAGCKTLIAKAKGEVDE